MVYIMKIIFGYARTIEDELPYSGLTSFDSFKTATLFETNNQPSESTISLWSDHIRNQYPNHSELKNKYKIGDVWEGTKIKTIQLFLSELIGKDIEIQQIKVSINAQGYPIYCVVSCPV